MSIKKPSAKDRLRNTRINDTVGEIEDMLHTLKNETYKLLTNYMFLSVDDLDIYMDLTKDGEYVLNIKAVSDRLIDIGKMIG